MNGLLLNFTKEDEIIKSNSKKVQNTHTLSQTNESDTFAFLIENILSDIPEGKEKTFVMNHLFHQDKNISQNSTGILRAPFSDAPLIDNNKQEENAVTLETLLEIVALLKTHDAKTPLHFPTQSPKLQTALLDVKIQDAFKQAHTVKDLLNLAEKLKIPVKHITFMKEEAALDNKTGQIARTLNSATIAQFMHKSSHFYETDNNNLNYPPEVRIFNKKPQIQKSDTNILQSLLKKSLSTPQTKHMPYKTTLINQSTSKKTFTESSQKSPVYSQIDAEIPMEHHQIQQKITSDQSQRQINTFSKYNTSNLSDTNIHNTQISAFPKRKSPNQASFHTQLTDHISNSALTGNTNSQSIPTKSPHNNIATHHNNIATHYKNNSQKIFPQIDHIKQKHISNMISNDHTNFQSTPYKQSKKAVTKHHNHQTLHYTLYTHVTTPIKTKIASENNFIATDQTKSKISKISKLMQNIQSNTTASTVKTTFLQDNHTSKNNQVHHTISNTIGTNQKSTHLIKETLFSIQTTEPFVTSSVIESSLEQELQQPNHTVSHETKTETTSLHKKETPVPLKQTFESFTQDFKEYVERYKPPLMKIKMQLNPGTLGDVDVTLVNRGNNLHVTIQSNPNTIALFAQNQTEFKNTLINMGFTGLQMSFGENRDSNRGQHHTKTANATRHTGEEEHQENEHFEMIVPRYI